MRVNTIVHKYASVCILCSGLLRGLICPKRNRSLGKPACCCVV